MSERSFSFHIFFSLIGVGGGLGLVLASLLSAPPVLQQLYQPRGWAMIVGGLLAVLQMSFSWPEIKQALALLWDILTGAADPDCHGVLKECVMLATRGREAAGQELKMYREIKPYLSHRMLQAGLELLVAGYDTSMIQDNLKTRQQQENAKYQTAEQVLQTCIRASWMLGLAAGLAGVLRTNLLTEQALLPFYFSGIAVPICLGLLLSCLFFYPLLRQVQVQRRKWQNYLDMNIAGVLLLQGRHHALFLETVLKAYLPLETNLTAPTPVQASAPGPARPPAFREALAQQGPEPAASPSAAELAAEQDALSTEQLKRFRPVKRKQPPV